MQRSAEKPTLRETIKICFESKIDFRAFDAFEYSFAAIFNIYSFFRSVFCAKGLSVSVNENKGKKIKSQTTKLIERKFE